VGRPRPKGTPQYVQGGGCRGHAKGSAEGRKAYPPEVTTTSKAKVGVCNLPESRSERCVGMPHIAACKGSLARRNPSCMYLHKSHN
jgi:hypothetical protein